jgi:hypothetical protein
LPGGGSHLLRSGSLPVQIGLLAPPAPPLPIFTELSGFESPSSGTAMAEEAIKAVRAKARRLVFMVSACEFGSRWVFGGAMVEDVLWWVVQPSSLVYGWR